MLLAAHLSSRRRAIPPLVLVAAMLWFAASASAATDTVTSLNDSGPGSLRETIASASSGDTIDFASGLSGTISLTSGAIQIGNGLTIIGPGADKLTIDGHGSGVLSFVSGPDYYVPRSISGLRFADASGAAAITFEVTQGTLTVSDSNFTGNTDGAIAVGGGDGELTISNSTFADNESSAIAMQLPDGRLRVSDSTFAGNHGSNGGAIDYVTAAFPSSVSGSTFVGNSADGYGGAIAESSSSLFTVSNSTFARNSAGAPGTSGFGGAIGIAGGVGMNLVSDTIDGNSVTAVPGSAGSGVWSQGMASVAAGGTIISGNTGAPNCNAPVRSSSYSLEGPSASDTSCGLDLGSADPLLGPLANNGGPTQTQALLAGSPALYRIPQSSCPTNTDQRGFPRPAAGQTMCDVGAFELQAAPRIDAKAIAESMTAVTARLTTSTADDLLVAFVSTGSSHATGNTASVRGGGLTWTLAGRENAALGDSEMWTARASSTLTSTPITATAVAQPSYHVALSVIGFKDATGIGQTATFTSRRGTPTGTIVTSQENVWVFAAGNDPRGLLPRIPGPGQRIQHEAFDFGGHPFDPRGDTYWVQSTTAATPAAVSPVTINDRFPWRDPYNMVLLEIL